MLRIYLHGAVRAGSPPVNVGPPLARAILFALSQEQGRWVPADALIDRIWRKPPVSATANLRTHVVSLRRTLASIDPGLGESVETLRGGGGAYRLTVNSDELDLDVGAQLSHDGTAALSQGHSHRANLLLAEANALCGCPIGIGLPDTAFMRMVVHHLRTRCAETKLAYAHALSAAGEFGRAIPVLQEILLADISHEGAVAALMKLLTEMDRPQSAIHEYQLYATRLAEDLESSPSRQVQDLYRTICGFAGTASTGRRHRDETTVTRR